MKGAVQLKRTSDGGTFNIELCIICQSHKKEEPKSNENGRRKMMEAARIKKDIVWERMQTAIDQPFKYHVDNKCYKAYTHSKSLQKQKVSNDD